MVICSLDYSEYPPMAGCWIPFKVKITNDTNERIRPKVEFYFDGNPVAGEWWQDYIYPGYTKTLEFVVKMPGEPGTTHTVEAYVDGKPCGNKLTFTLKKKPSFTMELELENTLVRMNDWLYFYVTITNHGEVDGKLILYGSVDGINANWSFGNTLTIKAGSTVRRRYKMCTRMLSGKHTFSLNSKVAYPTEVMCVAPPQPQHAEFEVLDANARQCDQYVIMPASPYEKPTVLTPVADILSVETVPEQPKAGQMFDIVVTVANTGLVAGDIWVVCGSSKKTLSLKPNEQSSVTFTYNLPKTGSYRYNIQAGHDKSKDDSVWFKVTVSSPCQTACETICQTGCEVTCETECEKSYQVECETICQTACEKSCQTGCEVTCEVSCQKTCQTSCEKTCETACETICQTACEKSCQTGCEVTCEVSCERTCEVACETETQPAPCEEATEVSPCSTEEEVAKMSIFDQIVSLVAELFNVPEDKARQYVIAGIAAVGLLFIFKLVKG